MDVLDKEKLERSQEVAEEFFSQLDISAPVNITTNEDTLNISLDGDDLGILIGFHGETLESLQLLLNLIINRQLELEDWVHVTLDVGGWKTQREEAIKNLVLETAEKVMDIGESVSLPPMSPSQRRHAHVLLQEYPKLQSNSQGEEPNRYIIISKK